MQYTEKFLLHPFITLCPAPQNGKSHDTLLKLPFTPMILVAVFSFKSCLAFSINIFFLFSNFPTHNLVESSYRLTLVFLEFFWILLMEPFYLTAALNQRNIQYNFFTSCYIRLNRDRLNMFGEPLTTAPTIDVIVCNLS